MKLIQVAFFIFGILGLIASIYNIYIENSLTGNECGLLSSLFLIILAFNKNKIYPYYIQINKFKKSSSDKKNEFI